MIILFLHQGQSRSWYFSSTTKIIDRYVVTLQQKFLKLHPNLFSSMIKDKNKYILCHFLLFCWYTSVKLNIMLALFFSNFLKLKVLFSSFQQKKICFYFILIFFMFPCYKTLNTNLNRQILTIELDRKFNLKLFFHKSNRIAICLDNYS